ncbi:hypothetical protein F4678DRAFT_463798 [Xylaria arbuscula]|nr:hypothetical protein F4678DRAFT_463798 [Xylaria arbuscula]
MNTLLSPASAGVVLVEWWWLEPLDYHWYAWRCKGEGYTVRNEAGYPVIVTTQHRKSWLHGSLSKPSATSKLFGRYTASEEVIEVFKLEIKGKTSRPCVRVDTTDHDAARKTTSKVLAVTVKLDVFVHTGRRHGFQGVHFSTIRDSIPEPCKPHRLPADELAPPRYTFRFDDWDFIGGYEPYGQVRIASIPFTYDLSNGLRSRGVVATVVHPEYNGNEGQSPPHL